MNIKNTDESTVKYLAVKTNIIITKLSQNYKNILVRTSDLILDQIVIKLNNWLDTHIYIGNGSKDEESFFIIYSSNFRLCQYGILSNNLNQQLEQIFKIINWINSIMKS
jgi:hypothetical protein